MIKKNKRHFEQGFSFIEVLIGVALLLVIALGLYGAFQLGIKVLGQSKTRITAAALANQQIEIMKNLSYSDTGTKEVILPFADGVLDSVTTTIRNNIEYTIETQVKYIVDGADGIAGPEDNCPNDYKRVKIKVSWPGVFGGEVVFVTDVAPKNLAQECTQAGGVLLVSVFDAYGTMVSSPLIEVFNPITGTRIDFVAPSGGKHYFPLATSTYKVVVSKENYSAERTHGTEEVANPDKPHTMVLEGQLTNISFSIDLLGSFSVQTLSPWGSGDFSDSFADQSKISESSDIIINDGQAALATTTATTTIEYAPAGYLLSDAILPTDIMDWFQFSWTDTEPAETDIKYQVFYDSGADWLLIPDGDLTGNSTGFDSSPVDLAGLSTTTYSQLKLKGELSTNNTSATPILFDWSVSWKTGLPTPVGNVSFNLQGNKIIGTDADEDPVYKYSDDFTTNSAGQLNIPDLEWDAYNFVIASLENLDLTGTDPVSDPLGHNIGLLPNINQSVSLFLKAENSLLATILNSETTEPLFSAQVRLYSAGLGSDQTQFTDEQGKTLFIPLEAGNYNIEIQADGYADYSGSIYVSGDKASIINLTPIGPS